MPKGPALQMASGSYTGTGSAVEVNIGFKPRYVKIFNVTDGDAVYEAFEGMTAAHAIVNSGASAALTANGISIRNYGFTAGSTCSESGDTLLWIAFQ